MREEILYWENGSSNYFCVDGLNIRVLNIRIYRVNV